MIISFLTDYGADDDFVGVCHGVMRTVCPEADIIDVTHGIHRHDVRHGALVMRNTLPYMPVGVHLAIVDPEVGSERRAVALRCADGRLLVGPDNGLLSLAWQAAGGVEEAMDVSRSPHRLEPVSATFHGRDLFAPVAARLACRAELAEAGDPVDPLELVAIELPSPAIEPGLVTAHALVIDRFGNVSLDLTHEQLVGSGITLGGELEVEASGERFLAKYARTFADVKTGEILVYEDAYRYLAIAINRGDAAATLRLRPDGQVLLRPR
jgi:S-adenosylmethionine hydrolase